jgi:hypothetical protein
VKTRLGRIGANLAIGALLYFNLAALLLVCDVRLPHPSFSGRFTQGPLPNHWVTERLFRMFDLFDRWSWSNWGFAAYGSRQRLATAPGQPTPDMVDLDLYRYFPQQLGEANRRIYLLSYRDNRARLKVEYERMADDLRRLYDEEHPEAPVEQVFLYEYTWKKDKAGYYTHFDEHSTELVGHD